MGQIKIVTDSTAYFTQEIIERYQISVVPLVVNFGDESFAEGTKYTFEEFYQIFRNSKLFPTTSQPSAGDFVETYKKLTDDGSSVISIHISSKLSGTIQSALTAASMLEGRDITVVDSLSTSVGLNFLTIEAAQMVENGATKSDIVSYLEKKREKIRLMFLVDTLEYLHRGGRIGGAAAFFGTLLQMKPLLHLVNGKIEAFDKVRTKQKALARLIEEIDNMVKVNDPKKLKFGVIHVDDVGAVEEVKSLMMNKWPGIQPEVFIVGPVIGAHVGPGTIGICVYGLD